VATNEGNSADGRGSPSSCRAEAGPDLRRLGPRGTAPDVAVVLALIGCVIAIAAHAPSTTSAYAQTQQIATVLDTARNGRWLLPRDHIDGLARKPPLYTWLDAAVVKLTGVSNDFTYRLPTVAASLVMGVLVYLLGRRWYGRACGLLAACLWATIYHMAKLMYLAVTDMILTMFVTASIFCADRLIFHPAPRRQRKWWALGFWAAMILGAMSKGWGVLDFALVGGTLALAATVWPGFARQCGGRGLAGGLAFACRAVPRRWLRAVSALRVGWGLLATAAVLAPLWALMLWKGGQEFRQIARYEVWARVTGRGEITPHANSVPAVFHLLYYMMPVTVLAIGAMALAGPRRWFSRHGPLALPLCWMAAVVVPFSLTHGFRSDYLLPAYAPGAIMGAWCVEEVRRRFEGRQAGRLVSGVRHAMAAAVIAVSAVLIVDPLLAAFSDRVPEDISDIIRLPPVFKPETPLVMALLIPAGAVALVLAVRWSLRRQVRRLAVVAVVGMLGVMFIDRHAVTRVARMGDGDRLAEFGRACRQAIGGRPFAKLQAGKLCTELYIGRFGLEIAPGDEEDPNPPGRGSPAFARAALENLIRADAEWLITCDKGLVCLGAAEQSANGGYFPQIKGKYVRFHTQPGILGSIEAFTEPIVSQRPGRAYLIHLDANRLERLLEIGIYNRAARTDFEPGRQDN